MAVNHLSRYMTSATVRHWEQAKRVLRYLSGTLNLGITYNGKLPSKILMWQDASFGDGDAIRSRTGFVAMMCGSVITWGGKLQPTVALSTIEAEYMAMSASAQELRFSVSYWLHLENLLEVPLLCLRTTQELTPLQPTK